MYPKLVALDTDWTIFWGWLRSNEWGKGPCASRTIEDNIIKVNYWEIQDKTNPNHKCGMFEDIPRIIKDIKKNGAKLAIVSRNTSKALCDRALWHWQVEDEHGKMKSIIDLVEFDEVYNSDKINHFRKIKGWTNFEYSDMILFDDEAFNNTVEMMLGVTFQVSRDSKGLTWDNYQAGLAMWRRNKSIHSPWHGLDLAKYPKRKLLGYSGMDLDTIRLLEKGGRRHDRKEAARWGFAVYVADDPAVAEYFSEWIKRTAFGAAAQTIVCAIYARDGDVWDRMNKIWMPDWQDRWTNVQANEFDLGWSQEDRDRIIAGWGVQKPYVLFARHPNMGTNAGLRFPIPGNQRFNELVIYPQVQENLIVIQQMSNQELRDAIRNQSQRYPRLHYEQLFRSWNITVPREAREDFARHGERFA